MSTIYEQIEWLHNGELANEEVFDRPLKKLVSLMDNGEIDFSINKNLLFNKQLEDDEKPTDNISLVVNRGSEEDAFIKWDENTDNWVFSGPNDTLLTLSDFKNKPFFKNLLYNGNFVANQTHLSDGGVNLELGPSKDFNYGIVTDNLYMVTGDYDDDETLVAEIERKKIDTYDYSIRITTKEEVSSDNTYLHNSFSILSTDLASHFREIEGYVTLSFLFKAKVNDTYNFALRFIKKDGDWSNNDDIVSYIETFNYTGNEEFQKFEFTIKYNQDIDFVERINFDEVYDSMYLSISSSVNSDEVSDDNFITDVLGWQQGNKIATVYDYKYIRDQDAYIEFANIQIERGKEATDFEYLPLDIVYDRCYRYLQVFDTSELNGENEWYGQQSYGFYDNSDDGKCLIDFRREMVRSPFANMVNLLDNVEVEPFDLYFTDIIYATTKYLIRFNLTIDDPDDDLAVGQFTGLNLYNHKDDDLKPYIAVSIETLSVYVNTINNS